mmetsp:Transcript_73840/g.239052  ORF Transcript_73840/g.239052 Transcript_73840/m.239052 type:complete len:270 (-) Transcript_73840:444-1253(-)
MPPDLRAARNKLPHDHRQRELRLALGHHAAIEFRPDRHSLEHLLRDNGHLATASTRAAIDAWGHQISHVGCVVTPPHLLAGCDELAGRRDLPGHAELDNPGRGAHHAFWAPRGPRPVRAAALLLLSDEFNLVLRRKPEMSGVVVPVLVASGEGRRPRGEVVGEQCALTIHDEVPGQAQRVVLLGAYSATAPNARIAPSSIAEVLVRVTVAALQARVLVGDEPATILGPQQAIVVDPRLVPRNGELFFATRELIVPRRQETREVGSVAID